MSAPTPDARPNPRPDPRPDLQPDLQIDPRPVLLATGGTGGHMVPAAALAQELLKSGQPVALVTDRRGAGFGDRYGAALVAVPTLRIAAASPSGSPWRKLRALALLALGLLQSSFQILRLRPAAVVGFGGYASAPTVVAAALVGIPVILHEQNAVLGRANRLLLRHGRLARRCWLALTMQPTEGSAAMPETRQCLTGNPVRAQITMVRAMPYMPPTSDGPVRILVIGGSQGASVFADVVPAAIALLPAALQARLRITQQCRAEDLDRVRAAYATTAAQVELAPFITDVPRRLADVHLVISRSGASTVTELTAAGRPAILVPYPHAMDDHQSANARILGDAGAAFVMSATGAQASFTPDALSLLLEGLVGEPELLVGAARAAAELGIPDAAARLAALVARAIRDTPEKEHKK